MSLPSSTTAVCLLPGSNTETACDDVTTPVLCADPETAADNPTECPGVTITGLEVVPASGVISVGSIYPFTARLTFSDGRKKDVSSKATWTSMDTAIATVSGGDTTGVAVGVATIKATYRGEFDYAQIQVTEACVAGSDLDIVIVFDRSGSMGPGSIGVDGKNRMERTIAAAKAFVKNVDFTKDRVSVVSFSGVFTVNYGSAGVVRTPSTTLHIGLSTSKASVLAAIDEVTPNWTNCFAGSPLPNVAQVNCATGIGGGLDTAKTELEDNGRLAARKVMILLTDGMENICNPNPETVATSFKATGGIIVGIALAIPDVLTKTCTSVDITTHAYISSLTTCELFFAADEPDLLPNIYATLPGLICTAINNDPCLYYY